MASKTKSKIGVVGLWHLGCTLSGCWSDLGHAVTGYDENTRILSGLMDGKPPIYEPGLEDLLKKNIKAKRFKIGESYHELSDADYIFLSYDTPVLDGDESDLTPLRKAIEALAGVMKNGSIVIVSSQTPAGTCLKFREILRRKNSTLDLIYSPENIRLGQAMQSYMNPGRIILGGETPEALGKAMILFNEIKAELIPMNLTSAEMVKHGINAFLATSITFANHMANLCEASGADIADVVRGMKTDTRIGQQAYLTPGIGFSGGTLGRDLKVMSHIDEDNKAGAGLFRAVYDFNQARKNDILNKLKKLSGADLSRKKVGVLGLTYKPGTSTLRRSLPADIVKLIAKEGAHVRVFDPKADYGEWEGKMNFEKAPSLEEAVKTSDVVVLLTEWPEFRQAAWADFLNKKSPQTILDTKNFLAELQLEKIGFRYIGIGRN